MWYPLLMFAIAAACMVAGRRQTQPEWHGSPRTSPQDTPYLWEHELSKKYKPLASRIGISGVMPARFRLEAERFSHRISKYLGLCQEFQSGSSEFDDKIYILSDQKFAQRMLQNNPELRHAILLAFAGGVKAIYATQTHLVADLAEKPANPPQEKLEPILNALHALKQAGSRAQPAEPLMPGAPLAQLYFRQLPFILFFGFAATLAGTQLLAYQLVQWPPIWNLLCQAIAAFALAHLLFLRIVYGRSAHGHAAFLRFLRASLPLGGVYLFFLIWFTNCHYDASTPQQRELQLPDWTGQGESIGLTVSQLLYKRLQPGDNVLVTSHAGLFGLEWVNRVEGLGTREAP